MQWFRPELAELRSRTHDYREASGRRPPPRVQGTFLIVSRIPGAEHDDWSCHKICQASQPFQDQETVAGWQSEIEDDQVWHLLAAETASAAQTTLYPLAFNLAVKPTRRG